MYKQEVRGGCEPRPKFVQEPPESLSHESYSLITDKYDRGHLVPNADYGCPTFIMGNVVPQLSGFNRGQWRVIEQEIRESYPGKMIAKGCRYSGRTEKGIAIPDGCYWLVFDGDKIINNGYVNQFTGIVTGELPPWTDQVISPQKEEDNTYSYAIPFAFLFIIASVIVALVVKCNDQPSVKVKKIELVINED